MVLIWSVMKNQSGSQISSHCFGHWWKFYHYTSITQYIISHNASFCVDWAEFANHCIEIWPSVPGNSRNVPLWDDC